MQGSGVKKSHELLEILKIIFKLIYGTFFNKLYL